MYLAHHSTAPMTASDDPGTGRARPARPAGEPSSVRDGDDQGAAWMLAWADGDEAAFERLVHAYSDRVHGLLTRFLGPVPEREDLTQEVFLRLVRAREAYRPTARFSTWLYRIVFNLAANERDKLRLRRTASLDAGGEDSPGGAPEPSDESGPTPYEAIARASERDTVQAAVESLPERQRMALVLAKFEGLPYAEIGEVLGLSEQGVKSLIHRARESLRQTLAPLIEEEVA